MKIDRVWAMPSRWTFTIKPIARLINEEVGSGLLVSGLWCDPFAGEASPAQITNDIHPDRKATHHTDALEFLKSQPSNHFDGVLYDPPYSFRQAKECYDEANIEPPKGYTSMGYWSDVRNELARITKTGGKAICFGWNTMGLGKKRGFRMTRVLLVPHGGNRNDTIVTVENKAELTTKKEQK